MSTRGVIARRVGEGKFEGRYHHWDSYPTGLGEGLQQMYRSLGGDVERMKTILLDEHTAGWSTICDKDWSLEPGYVENPHYDPATRKYDDERPNCYCHGDRSEQGQAFEDLMDPDDIFLEWAYVFTEGSKLLVLKGQVDKWYPHLADKRYAEAPAWALVAEVDLSQESDWAAIEQSVREPE